MKYFDQVKDTDLIAQARQLLFSLETELGVVLPPDYATFMIGLEAYIAQLKLDPDIFDPDESGYFIIEEHLEHVVHRRFPIQEHTIYITEIIVVHERRTFSVREVMAKPGWPAELLPFGHIGTGEYLCVGVSGEYYGKVYVWGPGMSGVTAEGFVANSFELFFDGLLPTT